MKSSFPPQMAIWPTGLRIDRCLGFSLIEITVALGIISFAAITLLGLIPLGLQATRDSQERMASAELSRAAVGITQQTSLSALTEGTEESAYYDRELIEVGSGDDWFYQVDYRIDNSATLPASGQVGDADSNRVLTITITTKRGAEAGQVTRAYWLADLGI